MGGGAWSGLRKTRWWSWIFGPAIRSGNGTHAPSPRRRFRPSVAFVLTSSSWAPALAGSFAAERFTREGRTVVVVDRHLPRNGSTAASTALLQWEIDASMLELEARLGFDAAASIYRRSVAAVRMIGQLAAVVGNPSDFNWRPSLSWRGKSSIPQACERNSERRKAGIGGEFLSAAELEARFGFECDGALLHAGSAAAHPMNLARMLLGSALASRSDPALAGPRQRL